MSRPHPSPVQRSSVINWLERIGESNPQLLPILLMDNDHWPPKLADLVFPTTPSAHFEAWGRSILRKAVSVLNYAFSIQIKTQLEFTLLNFFSLSSILKRIKEEEEKEDFSTFQNYSLFIDFSSAARKA